VQRIDVYCGLAVMDDTVDGLALAGRDPQRHLQRVQRQFGIEAAVRQPTMRRDQASDTNAVQAIASHVAT
jgi:hypothetical protein